MTKRPIDREARVSLSFKVRAVEGRVAWKVVVHRACDVAHNVNYDAAEGVSASPGTTQVCSAVVYADEGDSVSLWIARAPSLDDDDEDDNCIKDATKGGRRPTHKAKVVVKDVVWLHHKVTDAHICASVAQPSRVALVRRAILRPGSTTDHHAFTGVVHTAFVHTSGDYRIVWRVRFATKVPAKQLHDQYQWTVVRAKSWDPECAEIEAQVTMMFGMLSVPNRARS